MSSNYGMLLGNHIEMDILAGHLNSTYRKPESRTQRQLEINRKE